MKRLALLILPLLTSCAIYDAATLTHFDSNEYLIITEIRVGANHYAGACNNPLLSQSNATAMANKTDLFEKYSEQIPHNSNGLGAAKSLNEIAQGLAERYGQSSPVPPLFCKLKYGAIEHSAEVIQHVIGARPR